MGEATREREQVALMECSNDNCKGTGPWFSDSGNREWFVYQGDGKAAWECPECHTPGRSYPY